MEKHPLALNPEIIKKFTVSVQAPLPRHLLKHKERMKYLESGKTTKGMERKVPYVTRLSHPLKQTPQTDR